MYIIHNSNKSYVNVVFLSQNILYCLHSPFSLKGSNFSLARVNGQHHYSCTWEPLSNKCYLNTSTVKP